MWGILMRIDCIYCKRPQWILTRVRLNEHEILHYIRCANCHYVPNIQWVSGDRYENSFPMDNKEKERNSYSNL